MTTIIPRLVITPGEPAGIGPDLCVQLAQKTLPLEIVVIADGDLLSSRAKQLNLPLQLNDFDPSNKISERKIHKPGSLQILSEPLAEPAKAGSLDHANAKYVLNTLDKAIDGCMNGVFDGLVTGPVHKGIINQAYKQFSSTKQSEIVFTGHTEYIAERTHCDMPVMMLATEELRVALVTTHLPLSRVSENITADRLLRVIEILHNELINHFGIENPNILVSGLNPHAGEDGHLGKEEIDVISPVLNTLRDRGYQLQGPLPADTLFVPDKLEQADAVLAMYHDQGLPVLKHAGFGRAINITLGLPIIRTSVDHGVALDLAGTGEAKLGSLILAIEAATDMVINNTRHHE